MDPDDLPRASGDALAAAARADLSSLSVAELEARVATLQAEIARTRAEIERAINHRASAEALFNR